MTVPGPISAPLAPTSPVLLRATGVSKRFCRSLKRSLSYGIRDMLSEFSPFSRVSSERPQLRPDEFWAVDEVSFELRRGECLGLIGRNGAGKTTLLKMLNGLIKPDAGRIEIRGRVGALIALGAGFNPILTGRENIYVNASLLGLTKHEIDRKLDEIIDFAEIGEFIDSPVQSYSSGMAVRLGFAVATALEPDVLLLDEVLAVGDAGFRAKCYSRIAALRERAVVIFVSHSMTQIARLCDTTIVLNKGGIGFIGDTPTAIYHYERQFTAPTQSNRAGVGGVRVISITFRRSDGTATDMLAYGEPMTIELVLHADTPVPSLVADVTFHTVSQEFAGQCNNYVIATPMSVEPGKFYRVLAQIPEVLLNPGVYDIGVLLLDIRMATHFDWGSNVTRITIDSGRPATAPHQMRARWSIESLPSDR